MRRYTDASRTTRSTRTGEIRENHKHFILNETGDVMLCKEMIYYEERDEYSDGWR